MVKVDVKRKHQTITEIVIHDHAGYADSGQDLVCAGVSSITVGMMNALDQMVPDVCDFIMKEAYVKIHQTQNHDDAQLLLKAMYVQLVTLKESYQSYISINDQEV